jgi:ribosomal protein S18 acetylase RimI-like enzyme
MTISVRTFQFPADYEAAYILWKNAGEGLGLSSSDSPVEISKKLLRDPDLFLVAEDEGKLVGTAIGGFDGRRGMIYHLTVSLAYRRNGLATRLMDEIEARLSAKGCIKAYLMVTKGNQIAASMYKKLGWEDMEQINLYGKKL